MLPGVGVAEFIVILIVGLLTFGGPIALALVIVFLIRNQSTSRVAELEAENRELRRQLDGRDSTSGAAG
jgi:hypothetical protein